MPIVHGGIAAISALSLARATLGWRSCAAPLSLTPCTANKMTTALLDRLTHHCHIVETGNESYRFLHSTAVAKKQASSVSCMNAGMDLT